MGVLHFGFADGIYLKYGGETREEIDLPVLKYEHDFLLKFQLFITIVFVLIDFVKRDFIITAFALTIIL